MVPIHRHTWKSVACSFAICLLAVTVVLGKGKPPKPSDPPVETPPGTISFYYGLLPWTMDGDGENKTPLTSSEELGHAPSSRAYGGYHWSLFLLVTGTYDRVVDDHGDTISENVSHYDLFASKPDGQGGMITWQITSLYEHVSLAAPSAYEPMLNWSNDGTDSFVSCKGKDFSDAFSRLPDGTTEIASSAVRDVIVRIPVSGNDLESATQIGLWAPWGAADEQPDWTPLAQQTGWTKVVSTTSLQEGNFQHSWSPDGSQLVYNLHEPGGVGDTLFVTDLITATTTRVFDATDELNPWTSNPAWRPGGDSIAFWYDGDIWEVGSNGADLRLLIEGTARAVWSPDGDHLAFEQQQRKGNRREYQIARFDYTTGSATNLTGDLDKTIGKSLKAWLWE